MNDRRETTQMMNWCKESHDVEFSNLGNDKRFVIWSVNQNDRVLLHYDQTISWCAPSDFRVSLLKPAPKELENEKSTK